MKRFYSFLVALMACVSMQAQYVVSDKYDLWFEDTGYDVTTRKAVDCTDNYQDLWNGCYVRTSGRTIYIYRNNSSILYGEEINLLYNGYYRVRRGNTWYLADEDGDLVSGIYGKTMLRSNAVPVIGTSIIVPVVRWSVIRMRVLISSGTAVSSSSKAVTGMPWTAMAIS